MNNSVDNNTSIILEKHSNKLIISLILLVVWLYLKLSGYSYINGFLMYISLVLINFLLCYRSFKVKNLGLLIFSLYLLSHIILLGYPLLFNIPLSSFVFMNNNVGFFNLSLTILPSMIAIYYSLSLKPFTRYPAKPILNSSFIYFLSTGLFIWGLVTGVSGDTIFESGAYGAGNTSGSTLFEYSIIFYLSAYLFSGNSKIKKRILYFLAIVYVFKDLLYGGRVSSLQLILLNWFLDFQYRRISFKYLIILLLTGYTFYNAWGNFRTNTRREFALFETSQKGIEKLISSNASETLYSGVRHVNMRKQGYINERENVLITEYFISNIYTPTQYLNREYDIFYFKRGLFPIGGGGYYTGFFYVYGGYFLVVVLSLLIGNALTWMYTEPNNYTFKSLYSVLLCTTCARWVGYNILILFKLCVVGTLFVSVMYIIYRFSLNLQGNNLRNDGKELSC